MGQSLVEENGEAVACEAILVRRLAGTDSGGAIRAVGHFLEQFRWQLLNFQSEIADEVAGMDAGSDTAREGARLAVGAGGSAEAQATGGEQRADLVLLLVEAERGGQSSEILDGIVVDAAADDGDSNGAGALIEQIRAMTGRSHPKAVKLGGAAGNSHVFRDESELDTRMRDAVGEPRFAAKLMGNGTPVGHPLRVRASSVGEAIVPVERGKAARDSFAIGGDEQDSLVTLGSREARLGRKRRTTERHADAHAGRQSELPLHGLFQPN